jgi:hypothetical protein
MKKLIITAACVCLTMTAMANETEIPGTGGIPDLTKGGKLTRINERWAGPVGIYCGSWRPSGKQKIADVRQLQVLEVQKGSPADGILEVGDVILGADGTGAAQVPLFEGSDWSMIPIADAITEAEARNPALLKLLRWRSGKTETVTIKLQALGRYSDTAPYNCEKSKRILRQGIKALYESNDPGKANLGLLCLLAADDPTDPENDKYQARAKEWAHKLILAPDEEVNIGPWFSGPMLIILSEYYMKTKDEAILPTLVKYAEHHARRISWFGTTGHKWADKQPDGSDGGRLSGYGPINCSGALGFLGLSLARQAGVTSPAIEDANRRQRIFFGHYAFHGGIGYGEMAYAIAGASDDRNGVHAMTALALGLQEAKEEKAKYFTQLAALSSDDSRIYAHGGPFFGQLWQPVASAQGGVKAANMQFKEIRWHLDLKRHADGTRIYDPTDNKYKGFSNAATALLFYAMPLKQLYITGRGQKQSLQLSDAEFKNLLLSKTFDASKTTTQDLITELSRTQGMTRGEASRELAARIAKAPESPESAALIDRILNLATDSKANTSARAGACTTMMSLKDRAKGTLAELKNAEIAKTMIALLKDPDPYLRFGAVRAMQRIAPEAVRPHAEAIMDAIIATERPTFPLDEEDPLQWAHGEMGAFLFSEVLPKSIDGVDRIKLIAALRSSLKTPDASARNRSSRILSLLSMEELLQLADVVVDNTLDAPPANAMGGTAAPYCFSVLTAHQFEEALPLSVLYDQGSGQGVAFVIKNKAPEKFGRAVLGMDTGMDFMASLGYLMMSQGQDTRPALRAIMSNPAPEKLNQLKRIHSVTAAMPTLTLPTAKTELVVDATNYGRSGENDTIYTWRKVYGAGKVAFTPNASSQSKKTTVSFTDGKPGKYRFEVAMSDTLGFTTARQTVDVTLYDSRGKLPANQSPKTTSQTLNVVPGQPVSITLSGSDPDGDDLGFAVTRKPEHGILSGVGGTVTYTAPLGFNGTDQFTFEAIDGQGETATGTVALQVSSKNVGVAVYEPFDGYTTGPIVGQEVKGIGLQGVWETSRNIKDIQVVSGSLSYDPLPSSGGKLQSSRTQFSSIAIDRAVMTQHRLLENGSELWFSVVLGNKIDINAFSLTGEDASVGFVMNSHFLVAAANLDRVQGHFPVAVGNHYREVAEVNHRQKMGGKDIDWSESGPNMIIGRCIWGNTDADKDTIEIYRVVDVPDYGPLVITQPISVTRDQVAQQRINTIKINSGTVWDEVRIGPTLNSVLLGTIPLTGAPTSSAMRRTNPLTPPPASSATSRTIPLTASASSATSKTRIARSLSAKASSRLDSWLLQKLGKLSEQDQLTSSVIKKISKAPSPVVLTKADADGTLTFQSKDTGKTITTMWTELSASDRATMAMLVGRMLPKGSEDQAIVGVYLEGLGRIEQATYFYAQADSDAVQKFAVLFENPKPR